MNIRRILSTDRAALIRFVSAVPESDRNFFKQDIEDPAIVDHWLQARGTRLIAVDDEGAVIATVAVLPRIGWSSHVGEMELIVAASHRGAGLGRELATVGLVEALELGLTNVVVEVAADQSGLIAMFERLGFEPEALLRDFVRDRRGQSHDLLLLTHRARELWSELLTIGVAEQVG